jgi:hypothetical protein
VKAGLDFFSQRFAGFKFHNILALDFDLFASLRIAALAGFAVNIAKSTEADQSNLAISFL